MLPGGSDAVEQASARDSYSVPVGRYRPGGPMAAVVTGPMLRRAYRLDAADTTVGAVIDAYRERLAADGFAVLWSCRTEACGGFDFRNAVELMPVPAMMIDTSDFAQLSMRRVGAGKGAVVSVLASRLGDRIFVQTVSVAVGEGSGDPALTALAPPAEVPSDPAPSAPPVVSQSAGSGALLAQLKAEGHVRVDGLDFDSGGTRIAPSSDGVLDALATMLKAEPQLAVAVVGHSDATGELKTNLTVSERRAEAVRAALEARGVAAARLSAHGVGYLAPVASNATPEGRALNRRVELILR